jgi:cell division protein FtsI/penicillin-binding protein 2
VGPASRENIHFNRIYIVVIGLVIFWLLLEVRLFFIQVNQHDFYVEQSQIQSSKKITLPAQRGTIFDRNGEQLATNLIHYDLAIDLNRVKNKNLIANKFSSVFKKSQDYYRRKMRRDRDFVYLERKVREEIVKNFESLDDPGFVKIKGFRRFYPYNKYGSQLLGFTDIDDKGISGLELQYEEQLRGEAGWTFLLADAHRRFGYHVDFPQALPKPGHDIVLTLDKNFQTIVDDELERGVIANNANFGMAILMDPNTGEILAMSSTPGFDPNKPSRSTTDERRNRPVTDIFEPGSTFKVFPAAALLQENVKKPNDIVFCENGSFKFYDHIVHDTKKYGWLSFRKVVENSSNIGMVKLTEDLSARTFYKYLKNFGFDSQTGINLMGETTGMLSKPDNFSGITKGVISFGQEIGVTAIQLVTAFSSLINGGNLMRPYVVKKIIDSDHSGSDETEPEVIRQVISAHVSDILREFLLDAVRRGTGKKGNIEDVLVGGKTGTAQKYNQQTKRYKRNAYLASFVGFAPYESPRYVLGIFLDEPKPRYYGGDVAAPIFSAIMQRIIKFAPTQESERAPELKIAEQNTHIPDMTGLQFTAAEEFLRINDLSFQIEGNGSHVLSQSLKSDEVVLVLGTPKVKTTVVPNLKGKTVREALKLVNFSSFRVLINGSGIVVKQSPDPGKKINNYQILTLTCAESS